ncbi:MAG: hypothetical protein VB078_11835 [Clostridiaceae bacterium]|nr:hypothetical protein [Clostridiaceae bacterium]
MENKRCSFFLAANSKDGFVSFFDEAAKEDFSRDTYFIKSGPGCGKATAIRTIADGIYKGGIREDIYCSSDPVSLDGVIMESPKAALLDGTAPHVTEPGFPGARGDYITLSFFRDIPGIREKYPALLLLSSQSKTYYSKAYRLIASSALVDEHMTATMSPYISNEKLIKRALGIAGREIPKKGGAGKQKKRFIDGITPFGVMRLYDTVTALADRVYDFYDGYGLADTMLKTLSEYALKNGYDVYTCHCPKNPQKLLHVIIPELSLAFVTSNRQSYFTGRPYRRIRIDSYLSDPSLRNLRGKAKLLSKVSQSLMDEAVDEISKAHTLHDKMEELYHPHIDFEATNTYTAGVIKHLSEVL